MFNARLLFILMMPLAANASTLYRCTDDFGRTTYTNYKASNRKCQVLSRDDVPTRASASDSKPIAKASPADFPRVSMDTQKNRDGDRRYILEQELSTENKHLEEARKALAEKLAMPLAGNPAALLQPLRDRIALHERNLDALRREMSNLK
jgi:hypothetical protein